MGLQKSIWVLKSKNKAISDDVMQKKLSISRQMWEWVRRRQPDVLYYIDVIDEQTWVADFSNIICFTEIKILRAFFSLKACILHFLSQTFKNIKIDLPHISDIMQLCWITCILSDF